MKKRAEAKAEPQARRRRLDQLVRRLNRIQDRLDKYEWSDVVDEVEYCPCCHADKDTGHSSWCCLYAPNPKSTSTVVDPLNRRGGAS